jgi:hypothetical protein
MRHEYPSQERRDDFEYILSGSTTAVKKCCYVNVMGIAYILAALSGKAKGTGAAG